MILLSISPFIFIQCGSGGQLELFLAAGVSRHQPKKYSKRS